MLWNLPAWICSTELESEVSGIHEQKQKRQCCQERIIMMGLSGGGWTTTLAAAVDPRIEP